MSFYRYKLEYLKKWKISTNRKPLLVRGARQVGKSTIVRQFSENYAQYISLDLEKVEDRAYFENHSSVEKIIDFLFLNKNLSKDKISDTLLFIDEIQEYPQAIMLLRYFYEDFPKLHVIAAGSLLEHSLHKVSQFPVGRVEYLYMFPMNFQEYLLANGMTQLNEEINKIPISDAGYSVGMNWFHKYALIGGMPEIVKSSVENDDVTQLPKIYDSIWTSYRDDVSKYSKNNTEEKVIAHILRVAPRYIDERITLQNFGGSNYRSREVGEAFRALDDARVIQLIYPATSIDFPIKVDYKKSPRMQFLDTGILNYALGIQPELIAIKDLSDSYRGVILPHLVIQELMSIQEYSFEKLHFWVREKRNSQAEVDLVYNFKNQIIPVEIKSGATGRLRSLHQFVNMSPHHYAVRLYAGKFSIEKTKTPEGKEYLLMNLPYFLGMKLEAYIQYFLSTYTIDEL